MGLATVVLLRLYSGLVQGVELQPNCRRTGCSGDWDPDRRHGARRLLGGCRGCARSISPSRGSMRAGLSGPLRHRSPITRSMKHKPDRAGRARCARRWCKSHRHGIWSSPDLEIESYQTVHARLERFSAILISGTDRPALRAGIGNTRNGARRLDFSDPLLRGRRRCHGAERPAKLRDGSSTIPKEERSVCSTARRSRTLIAEDLIRRNGIDWQSSSPTFLSFTAMALTALADGALDIYIGDQRDPASSSFGLPGPLRPSSSFCARTYSASSPMPWS